MPDLVRYNLNRFGFIIMWFENDCFERAYFVGCVEGIVLVAVGKVNVNLRVMG
jgi:hypothetical protein